MSFVIYDLSFLVLFTLLVAIFLYLKRHNLEREGILYLYKTQMGVKLIDYVGTKFKKQIKSLRYIVMSIGYLLLLGILFILGQAVYVYIRIPEITKVIKAPPLVPLIPYFPKLFGAESLFPPILFHILLSGNNYCCYQS